MSNPGYSRLLNVSGTPASLLETSKQQLFDSSFFGLIKTRLKNFHFFFLTLTYRECKKKTAKNEVTICLRIRRIVRRQKENMRRSKEFSKTRVSRLALPATDRF